jgi:hypothetical protein
MAIDFLHAIRIFENSATQSKIKVSMIRKIKCHGISATEYKTRVLSLYKRNVTHFGVHTTLFPRTEFLFNYIYLINFDSYDLFTDKKSTTTKLIAVQISHFIISCYFHVFY